MEVLSEYWWYFLQTIILCCIVWFFIIKRRRAESTLIPDSRSSFCIVAMLAASQGYSLAHDEFEKSIISMESIFGAIFLIIMVGMYIDLFRRACRVEEKCSKVE